MTNIIQRFSAEKLDPDFGPHFPRQLQRQFSRVGILYPLLFNNLISVFLESDNTDIDNLKEINDPKKIISDFWEVCEKENLYEKKGFPKKESFKIGFLGAYELLLVSFVYFFRAAKIFKKLCKHDSYFSHVAIGHYWLGRGEARLDFLDDFKLELPVKQVEEDYKKQERSKVGMARQKETVELKNIVKYLYMTNDLYIDNGSWDNDWRSLDEAVSKIAELLNKSHKNLKNKLNIDIDHYKDILKNIEDWIKEIPLYPIYINEKRKPE